MNKAYFKHSFLSEVKMMLFLFLIGFLFYPIVCLTSDFYQVTNISQNIEKISSSQVGMAITFLAIISYVVPVIKFQYLQKKNQIDCFYSLPIKRRNLTLINLLVGYLQIIIPYTLIYFLGMVITILKTDIFHYIWYLPLYGISLILALGLFLFNSFIFTRGNSIIDGIIMMCLYSFVGFLTSEMLNASADRSIIDEAYGITFSPFIEIGNYYDYAIRYNKNSDNLNILSFIYPIILGIIGIVGMIIVPNTDKAERAEQITNSYWGYRVIIPFYFLSIGFVISASTTSFILFVSLLTIAYLIGEVIHYRRFKLPRKVFIVLGSCILALIIFSFLF